MTAQNEYDVLEALEAERDEALAELDAVLALNRTAEMRIVDLENIEDARDQAIKERDELKAEIRHVLRHGEVGKQSRRRLVAALAGVPGGSEQGQDQEGGTADAVPSGKGEEA